MTKTNDELRELRDDEIDGVTGGLVVTANEYSTVALALHKAGAGSSSNGPGYNA